MAKLKAPKRQVAHKIWISDIVNSNYVKKEGWDPNYSEIGDQKISRVNVISTVIGKFITEDANYATLTLDDGTETIRVKAFGPDVIKLSEITVGNIVRFIGKIKQYEDEMYLSPEVVRELDDPNWIIVRKLEIGEPKLKKKKESLKEEKPAEEEKEAPKEELKETSVQESKPKEKVETSEPVKEEKKEEKEESEAQDDTDFLAIIKKLDTGEGAPIEKVIETSGLDDEEAKNFLYSLLKRGEVFEPKKGKLKVLD